MEQLKITKAALTRWLKARSPNRTVGECGNPEACVLALYLNDRSGRKEWIVGVESAANTRSSKDYAVPKWAGNLINSYDSLERPTPKAIMPLVRRA